MQTKNTKEQENTNQDPKLNIKEYLSKLFDIKRGTSKAGTIQDIKDGISIRGHTAWILIFSILIASIGLNVSSSAVVIGAMLIAPLMGPILGIGLSIAINDIETLKHALINFGAMMAISLITSFLFFSIPLFQEATPEIIARTKPDLRDVLIAIGGGLALIVSLSRRKEMTNTIAGVAIATALMPPICTAGYGLATGELNYFLGAMFLFIINSTFIALATFVILKFLRFPSVKYINLQRKKSIARITTSVALLVLLGSVYTFYGLIQEKKFTQKATAFVEHLKGEGFSIIDKDIDDFNYDNKSITVTVFGKSVTPEEQTIWKEKLLELGLPETKLLIHQGKDNSEMIEEVRQLRATYADQLKFINNRDATIKDKDVMITELKKRLNEIPFLQVSQEAKINYSGLKSISYARKVTTDFKNLDTLVVFSTQWYDSVPKTNEQYEKLQLWLKTRLRLDTLEVIKH